MADDTSTPGSGLRGRLTGAVLIATLGLMIGLEWHGAAFFLHGAAVGVTLFLLLATGQAPWSRRIFVIVGMALFAAAVATRSDWLEITEAGLRSAAFIAAFFTASACLRNASATSPSIQSCGRFLADQPPGRRYLALTLGGHLFGIVLLYGAIVLLGTLAEENARREPDARIRAIRIRRMMLAIQRGFVSTLCWSPLAFAMAISTTLVPGASWGDAVGLCLVSGLIMASLGWTLDTIFKPRVVAPRPKPPGSWAASLAPMLALLAILIAAVGALQIATGIRAVAIVLVVVPVIAFVWVALQNAGGDPLGNAARRAALYSRELVIYRSELVLLVMAGFIGTLGSSLISPLVGASGFDLATLPGWLILVSLVWIIPLTGLIGMNPILSVSLIAPLLPHPDAMGVTPSAVIVAITAGWALSGASSPYTATTLVVGAIAKVSAWRVGLGWNGPFSALCAALLSVWVAIVALL